jgi:hypothetical protein
MTAGWVNQNAPYDFTEGEWQDRKKHYPNLSMSEYKQLKKWGVEEKMRNKKYSFTEAYNRESDKKEVGIDDIIIPGLSEEKDDVDIDPEHYHFEIEPWDFIQANKLDFAQGNVIKYICRYKNKNGIQDLKKAKQYIDMLIDKELKHDSNKKK